MIDVSQWPTTTVGQFFSGLPWQGYTLELPQPQAAVKVDWRVQTVQDFFSRIVWDGRLSQVEVGDAPEAGFSYLLPVHDFFKRFCWEGKANIGVIPKLASPKRHVNELDLNDLSNLF